MSRLTCWSGVNRQRPKDMSERILKCRHRMARLKGHVMLRATIATVALLISFGAIFSLPSASQDVDRPKACPKLVAGHHAPIVVLATHRWEWFDKRTSLIVVSIQVQGDVVLVLSGTGAPNMLWRPVLSAGTRVVGLVTINPGVVKIQDTIEASAPLVAMTTTDLRSACGILAGVGTTGPSSEAFVAGAVVALTGRSADRIVDIGHQTQLEVLN
jgi:hypothetical protein